MNANPGTQTGIESVENISYKWVYTKVVTFWKMSTNSNHRFSNGNVKFERHGNINF